ncbi:MAG: outer membrane lipoprotein-sorting protein [Bdellovibrionales bacterium]|nr:outer membrane lipoprotein-sorting protein [Bdellovibrionales bacterium]
MKLLTFGFAVLLSGQVMAGDLLQEIDKYRNPSDAYSMNVKIVSSKEKEESRFLVYLKGNNKTLIKVLAPKKTLGRNMLMIGENMWVYVPNIRRSVRISLNQKLTGEAANGDISRMRWAGDYTHKIEKKEAKEWQLMLEATKEGLTYSKIRVWVDAKDKRPIKAEFLTLSGKIIKTATYQDYKKVLDMMRPSKIHIVDNLKKDQFSDIFIEKMENKSFPDSMFTEKSLE